MKIVMMVMFVATMAFSQYIDNSKVLSTSTNAKLIQFYATVGTTAVLTSNRFDVRDFGLTDFYFGVKCNSATSTVKVSASIWGSFDGESIDSLTTLFVDRTAETNLVDTITLATIKAKYPFYYIKLKGGSSGNTADTKVRLTIYAIKD
jgi:hypothetical protein